VINDDDHTCSGHPESPAPATAGKYQPGPHGDLELKDMDKAMPAEREDPPPAGNAALLRVFEPVSMFVGI